MNREIKFRGKGAELGEWKYGHLNRSDYGRYLIPYGGNDWIVDPSTIGQFIGLKDRNGKEVYEDDILRMYDDKCRYTFVVTWMEDRASFLGRCIETGAGTGLVQLNKNTIIEVIGNIHDNPELLKRAYKPLPFSYARDFWDYPREQGYTCGQLAPSRFITNKR